MIPPKSRILCSEDDADTRELLRLVLTHHGFEVVCSESSIDALVQAKSQGFDLFLVDNWMPGLTGDELTRKIREFDSQTPILYYSGAAYQSDQDSARVAGAQGYLVKPVGYDHLMSEVSRLIAEAQTGKSIDAIPGVQKTYAALTEA